MTILKPEGRIAPLIFGAFIAAVLASCLGAVVSILIAGRFSLQAVASSLGVIVIFAIPLAMLLLAWREHRSIEIDEKGISRLVSSFKRIPPFVSIRRVSLDWSAVQQWGMGRVAMHLRGETGEVAINLLWFKHPNKVIQFVNGRLVEFNRLTNVP